jgi:uncharacterized protein (TIGR00369 family)
VENSRADDRRAAASARPRFGPRAFFERLKTGQAEPPPVAALIGLSPLEFERGRASFELEVDPARHANPMGTLHGGVLCDLADAAMGCAYSSVLADDETFTTLELKINFLRPVWDGRLTATGRLVQGGRTIGLLECDVVDAAGRLVARASSTCMTLRGDRAAGR